LKWLWTEARTDANFWSFLRRSKSQHRTLPSSERHVAVLHPVVLTYADHATVEIAQCAHRGRMEAKPVGSNHLSVAVPLQGFPHDVEELLAEGGIEVSYEMIRCWTRKFGQLYAANLRSSRPVGGISPRWW
jgi:hypothetical protein